MRNMLSFGAASVLLITLGACASQKAPVEETKPVTPPPVVQEQPKVEAPVETAAVPVQPTGPRAGSVEDFVVSVGDRVYFDLDQYNLDATDRARLDRQAAWLQSYPSVRVLIAGNCDERGTREYNLALGERRANAVRTYLVSLGVDPARIETVSYGKERPVDPRSTDEAWSLNRNSQTQITSGAGS